MSDDPLAFAQQQSKIIEELWDGLLDNGLKFRPLTLPDIFIDHDKPASQIATAGLDAKGIAASVLQALGEAALESPARA